MHLSMYLAMAVLFKHACRISMKHTMPFSPRACVAYVLAKFAAALHASMSCLAPLAVCEPEN